MTKTKVLVISGAVTLLAILAGGGYYFERSRNQQSVVSFGNATTNVPASTAVPVDPTKATPNSISLNQNFDTPEAGGLSVGSNSGSTSAMQAAGTQQSFGQTGSNSNTSNSGSANQTNPFDPTTFAQYDKYKNDKGGLFADVQPGTGTALVAGKRAAVYYRGWLTNGTKFDESRPGSDGKLTPFVFTLGKHEVITGWEQALEGMKVGGVRLVIVPPAVGYGATAQSGIPANSVLVFQVQLADVQ